jgi:uroporphyrin-III C-methyltransferase/precorrin-2 dehydrogenase/sirohydrochlorin ferrochelatase
VSSAIAAPELAGIPVTHRGVSSAFLVVSGHDPQAFASAVRGFQPNDATLVVLMGMGGAGRITATLLERGWPAGTPAAIVANASTAEQQVWRGTIGQLANNPLGRGPATIIIGDVVALASGEAAELTRKYVTGT